MRNDPPQIIWSEVAKNEAETELTEKEKGFTIFE